MKLYTCSHCNNLLYFENNICLTCGHMVGFDAPTLSMITLRNESSGTAESSRGSGSTENPGGTGAAENSGSSGSADIVTDIRNKRRRYRWCENARHGTCNWLIPVRDTSSFCIACRLNRTIPTLSDQLNLTRWKRIEVAKHRLVYSLLRLGLPVDPKQPEPPGPAVNTDPAAQQPDPTTPPGIAFDFMADISPDKRILTGHNEGVITLNIEEADEAERARNKEDLGEKYRTLLGHFRHEIGHYYWDVLIKDSPAIDTCRNLFGDERKDYQQALTDYYAQGAPADWADRFISPYATAHPWEDWAETWSHYMHMMDTLETAYAFGIGIHAGKKNYIRAEISRDPYELADFDAILRMWLPLTFAVNSLNRSMGHPDFYPFVISPAIIEKLRFIHKTADKLVS